MENWAKKGNISRLNLSMQANGLSDSSSGMEDQGIFLSGLEFVKKDLGISGSSRPPTIGTDQSNGFILHMPACFLNVVFVPPPIVSSIFSTST
jgi:hypothetical protein